MKNKKLIKNKFGKEFAGLIAIVILLSSILAGTFVYESSITSNVVKENTINSDSINIEIKNINNINELNQ